MSWTNEDIDAAERAAVQAIGEPIPEDIREMARKMFASVMTCAMELAQARGGTMTAEQLARTLNSLWHEPEEDRRRDLHFSAWHHYASQGAQVATLQANVEELGQGLVASRTTQQHLMNERDALHAEVERLHAGLANVSRDYGLATIERDDAESRLAAIRESVASLRMSLDSGDLGMSEDAASELYSHLEDLETALEGDAPQESKK